MISIFYLDKIPPKGGLQIAGAYFQNKERTVKLSISNLTI